MPLTDTAVRQAKPSGKSYVLNDLDGLALFVSAKGSKSWHFRFSWFGKQQRLSLGSYPEISLREARGQRDTARSWLAKGIDPRVQRRHERMLAQHASDNTFETLFKRWRAFRALTLKEGRQSTLSQIDRIFKKDVLPSLRHRLITEITRHDLLDVLRGIERRGAMTAAEKVRGWLNKFFRYAMVEAGLDRNPASDLDIVAMPKPPVTHNPHLTMKRLPAFLSKLNSYKGEPKTRKGLRLLLLTGVRTGELRKAMPEQFDLKRGLWIIPPENVKQLQRRAGKDVREIPPYIVPLPQQALAIVTDLIAEMLPAQRYLLAHRSDLKRGISENTLNNALHRMGFQNELTGHGIRGTISTALNELGYPGEWIEAQLSHADKNPVRKAYNHAQYVEQRRAMMQKWANLVDQWDAGTHATESILWRSQYLPRNDSLPSYPPSALMLNGLA